MNKADSPKKFGTVIVKPRNPSEETVAKMADLLRKRWTKGTDKVLRREIPLFTRYTLSQADLLKMDALNRGPMPCGKIDGEFQYDKELLVLWYLEEGYLCEGIGGPVHPGIIPSGWYAGEERPSPDLNPYEVMLHRNAEERSIYARCYVDIAVNWDAPFVAIGDIEDFSRGGLTMEAFTRLLAFNLTENEDLPSGHSLYDKWELAHFLYTLFETLPRFRVTLVDDLIRVSEGGQGRALGESINAGYEKLARRKDMTVSELKKNNSVSFEIEELDDDEFGAYLDMCQDFREIDFNTGAVFDHYEFQTWLHSIVKLLPAPVLLE